MSSGPGSSSADLPWIDAARMAALVPMGAAIDAIATEFSHPEATGDPVRTVVDVAAGQMLLMPAESTDVLGVKVATVAPGNPDRGLPRIQGCYILMDAETLAPFAVMDGTALTSLRTPATSAVTIRHCTPPDASDLVIFGTGPQAWGHIEAMAAVRPLRRVGVVGRHRGRWTAMVERCRALGLEAYHADPSAVAKTDVVCLCTTAREPLFDGGLLSPPVHVVAVGSHQPTVREVDSETVRRASVVVEQRRAATREAGDLVLAIAEGALDEQGIDADLHELVTGRGPGPGGVTLFKSVGLAREDLAVARLVHRRWREAIPGGR